MTRNDGIDQKRQRRELEVRLAKCRKLERDFERDFTASMSAKNLREIAVEIEQEIRALDQ